jgi:hypothetical protein
MLRGNESMCRRWSEGERLLAAGRYVAACGLLEQAAGMAWRAGEAGTLARVYLPLLEARRQIRLQAAEGRIIVDNGSKGAGLRELEEAGAGTLLVAGNDARALRLAGTVEMAARRARRCYEVLLLVRRGHQVRLVSPHDPTFAAGLPVRWTREAGAALADAAARELVVPLPPAGIYDGRVAGLGALAREALLVAWEALALGWQSRHALRADAGPWEELAWLRGALRIDPACEAAAMRLIAVAEGVARGGEGFAVGGSPGPVV